MIKIFNKNKQAPDKLIMAEEEAKKKLELLEKENQKQLELYNKIIKKVDNLVENGILPKVIIYGYQIDHIAVQKCDDNIRVTIGNSNIEDELGQELSLRLYSYISGSISYWKIYLEELIPPPPPPSAPDKSKSNSSRKGAKLPPILYQNLE